MSIHYQETQNEPEEATYSHVPVSENAVEEAPVPLSPNSAEILETPEQMRAREEAAGLRTQIRNVLTSPKSKTKDPELLLRMEFDDALALLREESKQRARRQKLFIGIFLGIVLLMVVAAILTHNTTFLSTMGSYVSLIAVGAAVSQKQKDASLVIAQFENVRAVGPLAEALEFKDKEVVGIATTALISLLPRMKASDAPLLSPEQRACLNRALRGKNAELKRAILKAWEQVGDTRAIEEVEKLAQGRGRGARDAKVVVAAQECLPFLRQSAERQQIGSQLLRPADGNVTPSDVLLRPAMPHAATEPSDQLLRPTNDA